MSELGSGLKTANVPTFQDRLFSRTYKEKQYTKASSSYKRYYKVKRRPALKTWFNYRGFGEAVWFEDSIGLW